ncbi:MAG: uroporphyrinogen decarboxylase family protein [Dehalococcoidia bacterium]
MERTEGPNFERLRQALLLQGEPDRVPLWEIGVDRDVKRAFLGGGRRGMEGEVEFWVKAGYDHIPIAQGISMVVAGNAAPRDAAGAAFASVMRPQESRYSVYQGADSQRRWMEEGHGVITSMEDFRRFPWPGPQDIDCSLLDAVGKLMPPGMKIITPIGVAFPEVSSLMGTETFFLSIYEDPELVAALFERIGALEYETVRKVAQHPAVGAVVLTGDIGYSDSLLVSPGFLRQSVFPLMQRMAEVCHQHDLPCIFHSDGNISEVLDDLIDCGIDAIHPVEPKAMDIAAVKQKYGHRLCLCGNIDLGYTLTLGTPEEVAEEVKQRLREVAPGGGYCVGSSNSVTEYVPLANFNSMRETVLQHGRYPISV